ncbi:MAG: DUF6151 family protein [Myxococcales bacterium]
MNTTAVLGCRCGKVRGHVADAAPDQVNRMVCYCDDCQAYLHYLKRSDLLDEHGGTDIVQVAPAALRFDRGAELIVGMRLSPKGLFRWYASCCNTPVGNSLTPKIPFVGIVANSFEDPDRHFGKPTGAVQGKFAIGALPASANKTPVGLLIGAVLKVLGWRLRGKAWPHPFFAPGSNEPSHPVRVIDKAERDALRAWCGPNPTAAAEPHGMPG